MNTNGDGEILPIYFFVAAILDLGKVKLGHIQAHTTLKHHVKSDYDIMNNQGDIAQNFENWPEQRPSWI